MSRIQIQSSEFRFCFLTTLPFANRWGVVKMGWILEEQECPLLEDWEEQCSVYLPALSGLSLPNPEVRTPLGPWPTSEWMGLELLFPALIFHMPGKTLRLQSPPSQRISFPHRPTWLVLITEFSLLSFLTPPAFNQHCPHHILCWVWMFQAGLGVLLRLESAA